MPSFAADSRAQVFLGLDDVALDEIRPWLRWSPALCSVFMASKLGIVERVASRKPAGLGRTPR